MKANELQRLASELSAAESDVARARFLKDVLDLRASGVGASVTINFPTKGDRADRIESITFALIDLVEAGWSRTYEAKVRTDRPALLAAVRRHAVDYLIGCNSKVEGLRFRIRELTHG